MLHRLLLLNWQPCQPTFAMSILELSPGTLVRVEVIGKLRRAYANSPKIGDVLP